MPREDRRCRCRRTAVIRTRSGDHASHRHAGDVPSSVTQLINSWAATPRRAGPYVQDRLRNVLAANRLTTALSPNYAPGRNLVKTAFLDPVD
ncbi:MAG: hypothetical protein ABR615_06860 [Pseudonocardiaceae bacterium]